MTGDDLDRLYDVSGRIAVVTGGAGVLCAAICRTLARLGAKVAVLDVKLQPARALAGEICSAGGEAIAVACDVLDKASTERAARDVLASFSRVDILVNGAGGNRPQATTNPEQSFFDLPAEALRGVLDLNLMGAMVPSQVFGRIMAEQHSGVILNISSMNA